MFVKIRCFHEKNRQNKDSTLYIHVCSIENVVLICRCRNTTFWQLFEIAKISCSVFDNGEFTTLQRDKAWQLCTIGSNARLVKPVIFCFWKTTHFETLIKCPRGVVLTGHLWMCPMRWRRGNASFLDSYRRCTTISCRIRSQCVSVQNHWSDLNGSKNDQR